MEKPWIIVLSFTLSLFFIIYVLFTSSITNALPELLKFNLIIVSATLGGLVLSASNNKNIKKGSRKILISAARKLIISTVLMIAFAVFFSDANISGFIDPNTFENPITIVGAFRGFAFWISLLCFFPGIFLFLVGIMQIILALTTGRQQ